MLLICSSKRNLPLRFSVVFLLCNLFRADSSNFWNLTWPLSVPASSAVGGSSCLSCCRDHFVKLTQNAYACEPEQPVFQTSTDIISIHRCVHKENQETDVIIIEVSSERNRQEGQNVFRVRLAGPEIMIADLHYCSPFFAVADWRVTLPGLYHVEIFHLFDNFVYLPRPPPVKDDVFLAQFNITVASRPDPPCSQDTCPLCQSSHEPGRWLNSEPGNDQLRVHKACPVGWMGYTFEEHVEKHGNGSIFMTNETWFGCEELAQVAESVVDSLQWQPYGCKLNSDIPTCDLANGKRKICFIGDSHMRVAAQSVVRHLRGEGPIPAHMIPNIVESDHIVFRWNQYGHVHKEEAGCTDLIYNGGAHFINGGAPFGPYASRLTTLAQHLRERADQGIRVYWMNTPAMRLRRDLHSGIADLSNNTLYRDMRSDPLELMFNSIANDIMWSSGVHVIDAYSVTRAMSDTSIDTGHYSGTVGKAIMDLILHALCNSRS